MQKMSDPTFSLTLRQIAESVERFGKESVYKMATTLLVSTSF